MLSMNLALLTMACVMAGVGAGILLRRFLPEAHLRDDSRDILKTAAGLIATLVALVLGLLVGSTKSSYDAANSGLMQSGARIVTLDRYLRLYGDDTAPIRAKLRDSVRTILARIWPETGEGSTDNPGIAEDLENIHEAILRLEPTDPVRSKLRDEALTTSADMIQSRWTLIEQSQYVLPTPFLAVLIAWLTVLYTGFGLLAPRNPTSIASLLICAVSVSAAVFLILELNHPFDGIIKVSSLPFEKALELLGR